MLRRNGRQTAKGGDAVADVALMLSLSIFFDGGSFQAKNSPPCVNINIRRVPGIAQDVMNSRVAPGWAEKSDERRQRRWKISSIVEKNHFNEHWQKEQQNSPPLVKKQKLSDQSDGYDVLSGRVTPESAADCHGWQQRPGRTSPMVGMFFLLWVCTLWYADCRVFGVPA